jgi:hypothetical protein
MMLRIICSNDAIRFNIWMASRKHSQWLPNRGDTAGSGTSENYQKRKAESDDPACKGCWKIMIPAIDPLLCLAFQNCL